MPEGKHSDAATKNGFTPGQYYSFDPPLTTNCLTIIGKLAGRKMFIRGECLGRGSLGGVSVFLGTSVDGVECFFLVEWSGGSTAQEILLRATPAKERGAHPHLRVVK